VHHPFWVVLLIGGSTFGWIFKRMKYAWEDHIGAKIRLKNAKRERRRAALWALAFGVAGLLILHVLL
jgi:hypothetical protein